MVKNCCVLGCSSNTKRNPAISFFRFPTDATLASMWLQLIGRPDFKPSQYSVICQLHFTREDFTSGSHHYPITGIGGQRKRLKTKAIPTQNLNGCTNPEMLVEIQMRAKSSPLPQKLPRSMISNATSMVNSQTNNSNNEAAQLQQLLTQLMPALFGNDSSTTLDASNTTPPQSNSKPLSTVFSNGTATPPFSGTSSPSSSAASSAATHQGPIISLPASLQTSLDTSTSFSTPPPSEPVMSTSIIQKDQPLISTDQSIFKLSNGAGNIISSTNSILPNSHLTAGAPRAYANGASSAETDLFTDLTNSLLAIKNTLTTDSVAATSTSHTPNSSFLGGTSTNTILGNTSTNTSLALTNTTNTNNLLTVQQPVAHEIPMETGNNAYIIDVDTYQKLMETVSQKSEKSIQTEQDITIFSLQSEVKQLKEQLCQYELAFNSLINWTEGSLKTEPVTSQTPNNEQTAKLVEAALME